MQKKTVLTNKWVLKLSIFLVVCSLLTFFIHANKIPQGFTFNTADSIQYFDFNRILYKMNFVWSSLVVGEGAFLQYFSHKIFYQIIFYISTFFSLTPSHQSTIFLMIYGLLSFFSFFIAQGLDNIKINYVEKIFFSLLYVSNLYFTYHIIIYWGHTPFLLLYILFPILFVATKKFFEKEEIDFKILSILGIQFFMANVVNGNMPFFISLNIVLLFLIVLRALFYGIKKKFNFIKKIIIYYALFFLATFYSVVPQINELLKIRQGFNTGSSYFKIEDWIISQAVTLFNAFFLIFDIDFYTKKISRTGYMSIFVLIAFILSMLLIRRKRSHDSNQIIINCIIILLIIILLNKGVGILDNVTIVTIFTKSTILSSIRSFDKTLIYLPFILLYSLSTILQFARRNIKLIIIFILTCSVPTFYPFLKGKIYENYSVAFKEGENFSNAEYSSINIIPDEYFKTSTYFNKIRNDDKIFYLPYNVINSLGWVNYPKWRLVGTDPTLQLFEKSIIQPNLYNSSHGSWNYGDQWNKDQEVESIWILKFSSFLNSRYMIYHKDVHENFVEQTEQKIRFYEETNLIKLIFSNEYFDVYKMKDDFFLPHFYTPQSVITTSQSIENLPKIVLQNDYKVRSAIYIEDTFYDPAIPSIFDEKELNIENISFTPTIEYKKINPTKYRVILHNATGHFPLIFSETYHEQWKLYQANYDQPIQTLSTQSYKILDGNEADQATESELIELIKNGYITTLGDLKEKEIQHKKWQNGKEINEYTEKYNIDYISKNFQGTIQNNNLLSGRLFETLALKEISTKENHKQVNGYANSWELNIEELCKNNAGCIKNSDGTYDLELITEFTPQRLLYLGIIISGTTFSCCIIYLIVNEIKIKRQKGEKRTDN